MGDMVDRQTVQEMVDRIGDIYPYRQIGNRESYSQYNEAWTDAINRVDAELNSLPSAQPNWIPVKEMLPEVNGRYLVTRGLVAAGALWNRVYIANYSDLMGIKSEKIWWQGNVGKSDFERLDDVVSWMPLPEPWEGEQDDQRISN